MSNVIDSPTESNRTDKMYCTAVIQYYIINYVLEKQVSFKIVIDRVYVNEAKNIGIQNVSFPQVLGAVKCIPY